MCDSDSQTTPVFLGKTSRFTRNRADGLLIPDAKLVAQVRGCHRDMPDHDDGGLVVRFLVVKK